MRVVIRATAILKWYPLTYADETIRIWENLRRTVLHPGIINLGTDTVASKINTNKIQRTHYRSRFMRNSFCDREQLKNRNASKICIKDLHQRHWVDFLDALQDHNFSRSCVKLSSDESNILKCIFLITLYSFIRRICSYKSFLQHTNDKISWYFVPSHYHI